jgi:Uma2 family endonuclease
MTKRIKMATTLQPPEKMKGRPPVVPFAPDLAVEVIIPGNTEAEMERKLQEYFAAGTRMVWYVYAMTQEAQTYRSAHEVRELTIDDTLDGEDVLPGFLLSIREWFSHTI